MKDEPRSAAFLCGLRTDWVKGRCFHQDNEQQRYKRQQMQKFATDEDNAAAAGEKDDGDDEVGDRRGCSSSTGCGIVNRPDPMGRWWDVLDPRLWQYKNDPENGIAIDDPSYEYQSASDNEILEYDSEASGDELSENDAMGIDESDPTDVQEWSFKVSGSEPPEFDTEFLPLNAPLGMPLYFTLEKNVFQSNIPAFNKSRGYEHVAGPGCRNRDAYLGKYISVEEMRGCSTVQCILWKKPGSSARSDDFGFERESSYFLTGVAETMPSSGTLLDFYPVRYGADDYIDAETDFVLNRVSYSFHSM